MSARTDPTTERSMQDLTPRRIVEELDKGEVGHDLLDDLMPAYKGWTADEIEHYLETGEMPAREYGDDEPNVIDVAPSHEEEESTA